MLKFYSRFLSIRSLAVPTIAAINGHAVGAGLCLALASDIRIVSTSAKLGLNFTKLGLHPGLAATHFLAKAVGSQQAYKLMLTGSLVSGSQAHALGMAAECVETDEVVPAALRMAREIALNSPVAVRLLTQTMRSKDDDGLHAALMREADAQAHSYSSADYKEGLAAVMEKRDPHFE
eukprot:TRINITY_DN8352_c0_g1_i1.p1 TRINITY_DN8352_c0_g1~~TRINITY_DN8352_c0_g1_i1.p1  ORF type:complete len:177 (+),score=46.38 TRINITY_DN8352_c0_g1_i1:512-1042(+)